MLNYLEDTVKLLHRIEDYLDSKLVTDIFRPKNHFFLELNTLRIGLDFVPSALKMVDEEDNIDKDEINYLFDVLKSLFLCSEVHTAYIQPDTAFVYVNLDDIDFRILELKDKEFEVWKKKQRYKKGEQ